MTGYPIGQAAKQTGVKVPTIRYYEQIGLVPSPSRTDGNRRLFSEHDLRRIAFVRHVQETMVSPGSARLVSGVVSIRCCLRIVKKI